MIDREKTYLQMIQNSLGTKMFRCLYLREGETLNEVLQNGDLSCAVYVSSLLYLNNLISKPHATVSSTEKDLEAFGWREITEQAVEPGCVIIWEKGEFSGKENEHIGFYIGDGTAISNHCKKGHPVEHDWKKDGRGIRKILCYSDFGLPGQ